MTQFHCARRPSLTCISLILGRFSSRFHHVVVQSFLFRSHGLRFSIRSRDHINIFERKWHVIIRHTGYRQLHFKGEFRWRVRAPSGVQFLQLFYHFIPAILRGVDTIFKYKISAFCVLTSSYPYLAIYIGIIHPYIVRVTSMHTRSAYVRQTT